MNSFKCMLREQTDRT